MSRTRPSATRRRATLTAVAASSLANLTFSGNNIPASTLSGAYRDRVAERATGFYGGTTPLAANAQRRSQPDRNVAVHLDESRGTDLRARHVCRNGDVHPDVAITHHEALRMTQGPLRIGRGGRCRRSVQTSAGEFRRPKFLKRACLVGETPPPHHMSPRIARKNRSSPGSSCCWRGSCAHAASNFATGASGTLTTASISSSASRSRASFSCASAAPHR